ncbi:hypothetical protein HS7_11400 [Sulfolobales archaeon HS-7]|nr:hypothetical protein HS7_11400 [Sulfolobales archaeon HS-7]
MKEEGIFGIISGVINRYITGYMSLYTYESLDEPSSVNSTLLLSLNDSIFSVTPENVSESLTGVDGSSRSIITSSGVISVAAVAVSSNAKPILGTYPSTSGKSLDLSSPFIAIAPSINGKKNTLDPYIYSRNEIMTISLSGEPLTASMGPEQVEAELRTYLETQALLKFRQGKTLIDGPLFPSLKGLKEEARDAIIKVRRESVSENVFGVVKRLSNSTVLKTALSGESKKEFLNRFKFDPSSLVSDEAVLDGISRYIMRPPYTAWAIGPIYVKRDNVNFYSYYLIVPSHKFVRKMNFLRIDLLRPEPQILGKILYEGMSPDGVPLTIAYADRAVKEVTSGIHKLLFFRLSSNGTQISFESKLEMT